MKLKTNFWLEQDGQVVLSTWRVNLLSAIQETGSISSAAARMNISYKRAWQKIHESEERLGQKLVETHKGGAGGGGSQLTALGRMHVEQFRQLTMGLDALAQQRFEQIFEE